MLTPLPLIFKAESLAPGKDHGAHQGMWVQGAGFGRSWCPHVCEAVSRCHYPSEEAQKAKGQDCHCPHKFKGMDEFFEQMRPLKDMGVRF